MNEEWKSILDGTYAVSSMGRVKRIAPGRRTHPGRMLKPTLMKIGYLCVKPVVNGKNVQLYVHRLVAESFLGPIPKGCEVNHKDGNKANPALFNLEYVTHAGNMKHASEHGTTARGRMLPQAKLSESAVESMKAAKASGMSYSQICKTFGIMSTATAWNAINGKTWRKR